MNWALLILALSVPLSAAAGPPVILVEAKVAPYREAAASVKRQLVDAIELEPTAPDVQSAVASAPVVVAVGNKALGVARQTAGNVPVVFCMVLGVTQAMLSPTVTGVPLESDPRATFAHLRAVAPKAVRLGVIFNPQASEILIAEAQKAAGTLGLTLKLKPVSGPLEIKDAASALAGTVDALWLPPDPRLFSKELFAFLLSFASERNLPLIGFLDSFTQAGALASVSADFGDIGIRAGKLAAEIQARPEGKRVPVPALAFSPGTFSLNLKTASALGIAISAAAQSSAQLVIK